MEKTILDNFLAEANDKAFSRKHRDTIAFNMRKYDEKVIEGKFQFDNLDQARELAKNIKWYAIEHLPDLLEEFEAKFTARGGKVIWAEDAAQARLAVRQIMHDHKARLVVKSKSMMTEEIQLNEFLEELDIEVLETDLGEYIVQLRGEPPYHIVTPAMHLSRHDIAALFHERFGTPADATPEQMTAFVRELLREKFQRADVGITGANFIIANTGSISITENEGNARLATSLPKVHIAIVGIEKVLPSVRHLDLFLPLLATYGTGQKMTVYNTILSAPRQANELDGAEFMYVILVDNGRSKLLADKELRQSLYCIRCGSCLNNCPVYRNIGGHTYHAPYGGPIGSVIMPHLQRFENQVHLSNASSLCGACTASCPVKIELHELLLHNRKLETERGLKSSEEQKMWSWWQWLMHRRMLMNFPRFGKHWFANQFLKDMWGARREFPQFGGQTFNQLWKKGQV